MLVTVIRDLCDVMIETEGLVTTMPCMRAVVRYANGYCIVVQNEDWRAFITLAQCGLQYSQEELGGIFQEIKQAECTDRIVQVHRDPPTHEPKPGLAIPPMT